MFRFDGRPAECRQDYNEVIGQLGTAPDESRNRFELWATQPCGCVTSRSVWLNPGSDSGRAEWLADGGATLQSSQEWSPNFVGNFSQNTGLFAFSSTHTNTPIRLMITATPGGVEELLRLICYEW